MSISKKFIIGSVTIFLIVCISFVLVLQQFNRIGTQVEETADSRVVQLLLGKEIQRALATQGMFIRAYFLDPSDFNDDRLSHYNELLTDEIDRLAAFEHSDEMHKLVSDLQVANTSIQTAAANAISSFDQGDEATALTIINEDFSSANATIYNLTVTIQEQQQALLDTTVTTTKKTISSSTLLAIAALLLCAIIIFSSSYYVIKFIANPLRQVIHEASHITEGNLSREDYSIKSKDEIGQLAQAFNSMKLHLRTILSNVQQNTEDLSAAAEQLSASTQEIRATSEDVASRVKHSADIARFSSNGAKESAIATAETSTAIEKVADAAQALSQNSYTMKENVDDGAQKLIHAQHQMATIYQSTTHISTLTGKLSSQSSEIGQITKVITDLSDQTNLLALNAAIEAARAGDHGKGFAVVADEVRKLAEQSKQSAEKIVLLTVGIQDDTKNVEGAVEQGLTSVSEGVKIIEAAGNAFTYISTDIHAVSEQIQEISAASEEMSASSEQVAAAVEQIAQGTEQSTIDLEMIAVATEQQSSTMGQINDVSIELSQNAQDLQSIVQKFKL